jgi:elongation factor Ts
VVKAEKRAERKTGAGLLETYVHNGRIGVILELRCETDFVAETGVFKTLAHDLAMHVASMEPENVRELLKQPFVKDESLAVGDLITRAIAKTGENIKLERFCRYEL